jgi:adhesin transport system membrane fusion protein
MPPADAPAPPADSAQEPLDALLRRHPVPTWRVVAWPVAAFISAALVWAAVATLEEVSVAVGEVVPQGKVKIVQHLEGGIVEEIFVSEGSRVRAGDPLARLNLATAGVNRDELMARLDGERLVRARLRAEAEDAPLTLPDDAAARHPDLASAERQAFDSRRQAIQSSRAVLEDQRRQRHLEVAELTAKKQAAVANLALARERLGMSTSLLSQGLTARMEHLELRAEVKSLEGEVDSLSQAVPRAEAAVAEAESRIAQDRDGFRRGVREQLGETEQAIARLNELLAAATDQNARADIRSPINGVVKRLRTNTIGGVVQPGEPIMEIVPDSDRLVVQARLHPVDRGYVHVGQPALVKISTYDFVRYGGLDGTVRYVAPDSTTDSRNAVYFEVIIETDRSYLGETEGSLPITPGMQATVDIKTGEKTVAAYLVRPVLKLRDEAFRER